MATFHKILVPVDYSMHSREAMQTAARLARSHSGHIILVNVYESLEELFPEAYWLVAPEHERKRVAELQNKLAAAAKELVAAGAGDFETQLLRGATAEQIVRCARERGCDLIVLGSHGRHGLGRVLLGSVAERVLRTAPCPVLVVKARAAA